MRIIIHLSNPCTTVSESIGWTMNIDQNPQSVHRQRPQPDVSIEILGQHISQDTGLIFRSKSTVSISIETTHREFRSKSMVSLSIEMVASNLDRNQRVGYPQKPWTTISIEIDGQRIDKNYGPQSRSKFTVSIMT